MAENAHDTESPDYDMDCTPYDELLQTYSEQFLASCGFLRTVDEYVQYINSGKLYDNIRISYRLMCILINTPESRRKIEYMKCFRFFENVSRFVKGPLHRIINLVEFQNGVLEPVQAPRGWTCSICLSSRDSHLCKKTKCGHHFHVKCCILLSSPACPLCRGFMI